MFKLPDLPSPQAEIHELADFAELLAWDQGYVSERQILAAMGRIDENDHNVGCDDNDDRNAEGLDEVMNEVERRAAACGNGYPFALEREGTVLRYLPDDKNTRSDVYRYLLLSTRMNMTDNRTHAKIDGTALLEELAAHALRCYLGQTRSRSIVFGTASEGRFEDKVNNLCNKLGEGGRFRNISGSQVVAQDDKLDAVAWVPFSDKLRSQLVIFAQCKTGSNWGNLVTQLQPDIFIKNWMSEGYLLDPVRAFCISEAEDRSQWFHKQSYAGLFFDRCRIVDFCAELDSNLIKRVKTWYSVAKKTIVFAKASEAKKSRPKEALVKKTGAARRKLR